MHRLIAVLAALAMLAGSGAAPSGMADAAKAEAGCWLFCESYRDVCWFTFTDEREYCDAWYQGCRDGCEYPGGPTSGGGGAF
ncbi:MAG: hypothetical protein ACODAB_03355 [Gemmatimonadota bacterium]